MSMRLIQGTGSVTQPVARIFSAFPPAMKFLYMSWKYCYSINDLQWQGRVPESHPACPARL